MTSTSIEALSEYVDVNARIRERFITPSLGGGRTVGVISEPLDVRPTTGWVVCHSFGSEFDALGAFEAGLARDLAKRGFAVLRFHAQGYGDSELDGDEISLARHVQGGVDASEVVGEETGVTTIGLVGARFGAMVAALTADHIHAGALALIDPVEKGRSFVRELVRLEAMADLADGDRVSQREDPWELAKRTGSFELEGATLHPENVAEIESVNLLADLTEFQGRSLVMHLSRSAQARGEPQRLADRLQELGGQCSFETIVDQDATRFGRSPWRLDGVGTKVDVLSTLTQKIIAMTVEWARLMDTPLGRRVDG